MSVTIRNYSEDLANRFIAEKERLLPLLPNTVAIEHVGSSAAGIGGKNIVDILIGVADAAQMHEVCDILVKNGYFEGYDSHDDRIFLASSVEETGEGDFHIHICPINSTCYKDFISLRDYLRSHPDKAQEYFEKKKEFAKLSNYDRKNYKKLKAEYVSQLLTEAKK